MGVGKRAGDRVAWWFSTLPVMLRDGFRVREHGFDPPVVPVVDLLDGPSFKRCRSLSGPTHALRPVAFSLVGFRS